MDKIKKLQLDFSELHNYRTTETVLYARDEATNKELRLTFLGRLQVWQNGKIIREFLSTIDAVEYFNNMSNVPEHMIEVIISDSKIQEGDFIINVGKIDILFLYTSHASVFLSDESLKYSYIGKCKKIYEEDIEYFTWESLDGKHNIPYENITKFKKIINFQEYENI